MPIPPPPPSRPPLGDRWHTREFPVLLEVAHALDAGDRVNLTEVASEVGISAAQIQEAINALDEAGYLKRPDTPGNRQVAPRRRPIPAH